MAKIACTLYKTDMQRVRLNSIMQRTVLESVRFEVLKEMYVKGAVFGV
jgi:hypothetical protein